MPFFGESEVYEHKRLCMFSPALHDVLIGREYKGIICICQVIIELPVSTLIGLSLI